MKFLGIRALKVQLSERSLGQLDVFRYWLASTILLQLALFPVSNQPSGWDYVIWLISLVVAVAMAMAIAMAIVKLVFSQIVCLQNVSVASDSLVCDMGVIEQFRRVGQRVWHENHGLRGGRGASAVLSEVSAI